MKKTNQEKLLNAHIQETTQIPKNKQECRDRSFEEVSLTTFRRVLGKCGIQTAFDLRSGGQVWRPEGGEYETLKREDRNDCWPVLEERFKVAKVAQVPKLDDNGNPVKKGNKIVKEDVDTYQPYEVKVANRTGLWGAVASTNQIDLFLEWLESLPPYKPPKSKKKRKKSPPILDLVFEKVFYIKDRDIEAARWASRHLFMSMIARAYNPGCTMDETILIVGPSGAGKSKFCRYVLPEKNRNRLFTDSYDISLPSKKRMELMESRALGECPELLGFDVEEQRAVDRIKAILTSTEDGTDRKVWGRRLRPRPRRWIVVGTLNAQTTLPAADPAIQRRFVPVVLKDNHALARKKPETWLDKNRDRAFAEALYWFRKDGYEPRVPQKLRRRMNNTLLNMAGFDSEEIHLITALGFLEKDPAKKGYSPDEIKDAAGYEDKHRNSKEVRGLFKLIRRIGWTQTGLRQSRPRYHPPRKIKKLRPG